MTINIGMGVYAHFLPKGVLDKERDYFGYAVTALNLLAGATATPTFAVQADSDFLLTAIAGSARDPANPSVSFATPALALQIDDGGSGRNLFNQAVHWQTVVGDAQLPFVLPYPKFLKQSSTVNVTLTNLDLAQALDVRITFHGFKMFNWARGT